MATSIILSMDKYDVRRYGGRKIRELIEDVAGEDVEVEVFSDTGRVVVNGGSASAAELRDELAYELGVGVSVIIFSEIEAHPKLEFASSDENEEDDDDEEEEDDDDESEEETDDDNDTCDQMASLSLGTSGEWYATAIPEPSWEDQPIADPAPYFFQQFDNIPSYSED